MCIRSQFVIKMDLCICEMKGGPREGQPCGKPVFRFGECRYHYKKTNTVYEFHVREQQKFLSLPTTERVKKFKDHKSFYHQSLEYIYTEDKRRIAYRVYNTIEHSFHTLGPMSEHTCSICYQSSPLVAFPCHWSHIVCNDCLLHLVDTSVETRHKMFVNHDSPMTHTFRCPLCRDFLHCVSHPM